MHSKSAEHKTTSANGRKNIPASADDAKTHNSHSGLKLALTTREACEALGGISPRSLARLEARSLIRSSKALRHKLWPVSEINRFLEETK